MADNTELLLKALTTSDIATGGQLSPKQLRTFVKQVRTYNGLLDATRFEPMTQKIQEFDRMHLGEPITRRATEATSPTFTEPLGNYTNELGSAATATYRSTLKFSKILLTATKVRSDASISTESLQENIEGNDLEAAFWNALAERFAQDAEEVILNGDTSITANTPLNELRSCFNGWGIYSESTVILDAGGDYIGKQLLSDTYRMLPKEYKRAPNLSWIMSDQVYQDWTDMLTERPDSVGADALRGITLAPFGKPVLQSLVMRDDLPLTTTNAVAQAVSGFAGPFKIGASTNFSLFFTAWDASTTDFYVNFPAGVWDTEAMLAFLTPNNGFGGNSGFSKPVVNGNTVYRATYHTAEQSAATAAAPSAGNSALPSTFRAVDIGDGRIMIYMTTTGDTAQGINIDASGTAAFDANAILGFPVAAVGTAGSNPTGTQREGSYILLTNPKNLVWGMLDGMRTFTEFKKDNDTIETTIYNHLACNIENPRAVVRISNLRRRTAYPSL